MRDVPALPTTCQGIQVWPRTVKFVLTDTQILALILAIAALPRVSMLGHAPLWWDEAATAAFAGLPWDALFHGVGRLEPNPPAFYALEKLWTSVAGGSDGALRILPALAGLAGVAALWAFTRAAFGRRTAVWAGMLLATNAHHIEHSRDARVYTLLFVSVACTALAARRTALARGHLGAILALAVTTGATITLHYTGVIAAGCVFVYAGVLVLSAPVPKLSRLASLAAGGVCGLLLGAPTLTAMFAIAADKANNAAMITVPDGFTALVFALSVWASPFSWMGADTRLGLASTVVAFVAVAIVLGASATRCVNAQRFGPDTRGLLAGLLAAVLSMTAISQFTPVLTIRTLFFALVFLLPLVAATLVNLSPVRRGFLLTMLLAVQVPNWSRLSEPIQHREDWRGAANTIAAEVMSTGYPVITLGAFDAATIGRYLPDNRAAQAVVSISPHIGYALNQELTGKISGADPVPIGAPPAELCRHVPASGGAIILERRYPSTEPQRSELVRMLEAGGGQNTSEAWFGVLTVERWPGLCASSRG